MSAQRHSAARRRRQPSDEATVREAEILKAAAVIFQEKGFAASTTQDIADRVGMLKGSLYYYIRSKEDLLYRIALQVYAELKREQALASDPDSPPIDQLKVFIRTHVLHTMNNLAETAAFYQDFKSLTGKRLSELIQLRDEYEGDFRAIFRACQADGSARRNLDSRLVSLNVFAMMNSLHVWYHPEGRRTPRQIADATADLAINGVSSSD
jgi:AcrR family transcriptional regulator